MTEEGEMILLRSSDGWDFGVAEEVAPAQFLSLDIVRLFNLIQAAHFLKLKKLMDLSCNVFVIMARKIKIKSCKTIVENVNIGERLKGVDDMSPGLRDQQVSDKGCSLNVDSILRNRTKDTFINDSDFLDVYFSPFITSQLPFIKRQSSTFDEYLREVTGSKNFEGLLKAICRLEKLICGDFRVAYCLKAGVVRYLVMILNQYEDIRVDIKRPIVSILSRARFDVCRDVMEKEVLLVLVEFMSHSDIKLSNSAVIALTRVAYAFPDHIKVIVDKGALVAAHKVLKNHHGVYRIMDYLAKFLTAVCRGYSVSSDDNLPSDKVGEVLTILDSLCEKWSYQYRTIHIVRCYALLHLSYGRCVALEKEAWNRLKRSLIDYISIANKPGAGCLFGVEGNIARKENLNEMIAGSALGVVGNIVRWGNEDQFQSLTGDHQLLRCLRSMLCSGLKKFRKEACQIISNIAAKSKMMIKDIVEARLEEHLCDLLRKDEGSDVKMEAAWAIFNIVCGNINYDVIDKYPGYI